jgi:hypothetical protein
MTKTKSKNRKPLVPQTELLNGHSAPTEFYDLIQAHIAKQMPEIKSDVLYTSRMICGEVFWSDLPSNWWRVLAGRCFAHMVSKKLFTFEFIQYKKSSTKHYFFK